jgi:23S rRNA (adenine2503-C2)-methyltransferase
MPQQQSPPPTQAQTRPLTRPPAQPLTLTDVPRRRGKPPRHLADLDSVERRAAVVELGEPAFRAEQLSRHYFTRLVDDPAAWTDIPAPARVPLAKGLLPVLATPVRHIEADAGATRKSLWRLHDGTLVESVLMRYRRRTGRHSAELGEEANERPGSERITVCVSSQAGCGMACPFCATGQAGLTRNLSAAEIVEQVVASARMLRRDEVAGGTGRVSNVVFMGMGEPLANYRAVLGAVRRLTEPAPVGLGMSARGITVSTVGLVPAMERLADEGLAVTLALSLHAPDDDLRDELVPVNTRWKVAEVLDAARAYFDTTGRRVSIEYALIKDINDQAWRADLLGELLTDRGRGWVHINPIPLNPTPGSKWTASTRAVERTFVETLSAHGLAVTVRDTRGREIDGACGQLAATEG